MTTVQDSTCTKTDIYALEYQPAVTTQTGKADKEEVFPVDTNTQTDNRLEEDISNAELLGFEREHQEEIIKGKSSLRNSILENLSLLTATTGIVTFCGSFLGYDISIGGYDKAKKLANTAQDKKALGKRYFKTARRLERWRSSQRKKTPLIENIVKNFRSKGEKCFKEISCYQNFSRRYENLINKKSMGGKLFIISLASIATTIILQSLKQDE